MNRRNSFLGTGWGFPVTFKKKGGDCSIRTVSEVEDIKESLTILFSTRPGERVLRPDYGASMDDMVFEPVNESLKNYLIDLIEKAILYYEARINLEEITLTDESMEGRVIISMTFSVKTTNSRFNYVFDYYKREATIVPL